MTQMYVIGEDGLCCALGEKLVTGVAGYSLAQPAVNTEGVTKLKKEIHRYLGLTRIHPVLCVADTDRKCALELLRSWLPDHVSPLFMLRFAVTESESWLLADKEGLADFLGVSESWMPRCPDDLEDAKRELLNLARRSRKRNIRQEMVSSREPSKPGSGYNFHLRNFIARQWQPLRAVSNSPSLARAMRQLEHFQKERYGVTLRTPVSKK